MNAPVMKWPKPPLCAASQARAVLVAFGREAVVHRRRMSLITSIFSLTPKHLRTHNDDQKTGVDIVRKALSAPARQIAINAGEDGSVIVGKILEKDQYGFGFDAQSGEYGNLVAKGIIDPTKVVRAAEHISVDRWSSDHHRSHGRRKAEEGQWGTGHAWRWHGRHGLLSPPSTEMTKARGFFRAFSLVPSNNFFGLLRRRLSPK